MRTPERTHPRRRWLAGLAAAIALSVAACGATDTPREKSKEPAAAEKGDVQLVQTDYAGFFKAVDKLKGKVVLVDVWGEF